MDRAGFFDFLPGREDSDLQLGIDRRKILHGFLACQPQARRRLAILRGYTIRMDFYRRQRRIQRRWTKEKMLRSVGSMRWGGAL
jgi:hypothetical protein